MKDLTQEEIGRWLDAVPQTIQDMVLGNRPGEIVEEIGRKYALHVDVQGVLLKLTNYMLLGYSTPQQVFEELVRAGINEAQIKQIMQELNEKIFKPLHNQMRQQSNEPVLKSGLPQTPPIKQTIPVPSYQSRPAPPPPRPTQSPAPAPRPTPPPPRPTPQPWSPQDAILIPANPSLPQRPLENQSVKKFNLPRYTPPQRPAPAKPAPTFNNTVPQRFAKPAPGRAMTESSRLLEDHEEPHIELNDIPPRSMLRPGGGAPANLPGTLPPTPAPPRATQGTAPPPAAPYSVDPYREPIDE